MIRRNESAALILKLVMVCSLLFPGRISFGQSVSPVIVEYTEKAEGRIALTNNTLFPMAVMMEPRSFSINPDGNGIFRSLDPAIHVELSALSFRINPGQTYYVFYKAKAERLPAWFTIYSTFSAVSRISDLDLRILLPHTVYIYPKKPKLKDEVIEVKQAAYQRKMGKIICDFSNSSSDLERVEEIRIASDSKSITAPGFPLLPFTQRHIEVDWNGADIPRKLELHLDRSTVKLNLSTND